MSGNLDANHLSHVETSNDKVNFLIGFLGVRDPAQLTREQLETIVKAAKELVNMTDDEYRQMIARNCR